MCNLPVCALCTIYGGTGFQKQPDNGLTLVPTDEDGDQFITKKIQISEHLRPIVYKCATVALIAATHAYSNSTYNAITTIFGDKESYCSAPFNCKRYDDDQYKDWGISHCPGPSHVMMPSGALTDPQQCYFQKIKSLHGICLDSNGAFMNGQLPHMWPCGVDGVDEIANQRWSFDYENTGLIKNIGKNKYENLCLDANHEKKDVCDYNAYYKVCWRVHMWKCDASNINQAWTWTKSGLLTPRDSSMKNIKCLNASVYVLGGPINMADCTAVDANQQFMWSWANKLYGGPTKLA